MRSDQVLRLLVVALPVALLACGGAASGSVGAALARGQVDQALAVYERDPADAESLREIARAVLSREALSPDPAQSVQALAALQRAGDRAQVVLERLAEHGAPELMRARALAILAERGDASARERLHALLDLHPAPALRGGAHAAGAEPPEPAVQAVAVRVLDPVRDITRLRELAVSPSSGLRLAAIGRLARSTAEVETRVLLLQAVRSDPERAVRLAALRALSAQGPEGVEAIEARVDDPEPALRLLAIGELVRADYARAERRLAQLLAAEPSAEGIEAARALLSAAPQRAPDAAIAQLQRALVAKDNALRGAAAVALMSVRDPRTERLATERAALEPVRSVKLCLALALGPSRAQAQGVLTALLAEQDVVATQAAAELAQRGDARALQKLQASLASKDAVVRRVAVEALGRELGRRDRAVLAMLLDADAGVRISAAGALLAG